MNALPMPAPFQIERSTFFDLPKAEHDRQFADYSEPTIL